MVDAFDIAVIGGGIAGLSVAAELAGEARVVVLETEDQPGYHATGRSAAIFAQNYGNALIRALSAWSEGQFSGDVLSRRGLVRVATAAQRERLRALYDDMGQDTPLDWLEAEAVAELVPLFRPGHADCAFLNPAAADMDVGAIMAGYARRLSAPGALRTRFRVTAADRKGGLWSIRSDRGDEVRAGVVVNAAGAWADEVGTLFGARALGLVPKRRSAVTVDAPPGTDLRTLPMVVDADEDFYLKPEGGRLMASPCDATPAPPADSRPEELDIAICLDRIETAFDIPSPRPRATWSGLRTFAPDGHPVCGWDPDLAGLFWLAGQGGYGVQTAPALARLAADAVLDRTARTEIARISPDALAPSRFAEGALAQ